MSAPDETLVEQFLRHPAELREAFRRLGANAVPLPMRAGGCTAQQRAVLIFCRDYHAEKGITPSFDEITAAIGVKSKSNVHRIVTALEDRGFIRRRPNAPRSIELVAGAF